MSQIFTREFLLSMQPKTLIEVAGWAYEHPKLTTVLSLAATSCAFYGFIHQEDLTEKVQALYSEYEPSLQELSNSLKLAFNEYSKYIDHPIVKDALDVFGLLLQTRLIYQFSPGGQLSWVGSMILAKHSFEPVSAYLPKN